MSVAYFKDRLKNAAEINAEREEMNEIEKIEKMEWEKSFTQLERYLERDETPRGPGNRHSHETRIRLSVEKIARMEAERLGMECVGDWVHANADPRLETPVSTPLHQGSNRTSDLRNNFVYQLFGQNVMQGGDVRTYAQFSVHFAMRAVVRLLTEVHGGAAMLAELDPDRTVQAAKEDALRFYQHLQGLQDQLDEDIPYDDNTHPLNVVKDPFELANMMRDWIPGIDVLAESLLIAYSDAVRMERAFCQNSGDRYHDGTLPDEAGAIPLRRLLEVWPEELRIQQACLEYMDSEGTIREIATKFRIGRNRFNEILAEKGLLRQRGRRPGKEAA